LAESIDVHLDTVYRALKRLSPLIDHSYGEVQVGSKYIAQELTGYIDSVSESIQSDRSDDADPGDLDIGFQPADLKEARRLLREGAISGTK